MPINNRVKEKLKWNNASFEAGQMESDPWGTRKCKLNGKICQSVTVNVLSCPCSENQQDAFIKSKNTQYLVSILFTLHYKTSAATTRGKGTNVMTDDLLWLLCI